MRTQAPSSPWCSSPFSSAIHCNSHLLISSSSYWVNRTQNVLFSWVWSQLSSDCFISLHKVQGSHIPVDSAKRVMLQTGERSWVLHSRLWCPERANVIKESSSFIWRGEVCPFLLNSRQLGRCGLSTDEVAVKWKTGQAGQEVHRYIGLQYPRSDEAVMLGANYQGW